MNRSDDIRKLSNFRQCAEANGDVLAENGRARFPTVNEEGKAAVTLPRIFGEIATVIKRVGRRRIARASGRRRSESKAAP